jgi:hypothetical protein
MKTDISENDIIAYYGFEDDKLLSEISMRYKNKVYLSLCRFIFIIIILMSLKS